MSNPAQKKAIDAYRARLAERGIMRFEIQALETDRALIRELARRMSAADQEAALLRKAVQQAVDGKPKTGGVLAALLCAPNLGDDFSVSREDVTPRPIDL